MSPIFWFIIAGIVVGGVAIIIAIAAVNGVGLPAGQFTLPTWRNVGAITLAVLALLVLYFGILTPKWGTPRPADVGIWSSSHWFWLLILWGIVSALIALNARGAATKTLQWVLAGVVVAMLVVFPLWGWATSPTAPAHAIAATQSETQTREMPTLTMPPGGKTGLIASRPGKRVVLSGKKFLLHNVYRDGRECAFGEQCTDGPLVGVYATNEDGKNENTVSVSYQ